MSRHSNPKASTHAQPRPHQKSTFGDFPSRNRRGAGFALGTGLELGVGLGCCRCSRAGAGAGKEASALGGRAAAGAGVPEPAHFAALVVDQPSSWPSREGDFPAVAREDLRATMDGI